METLLKIVLALLISLPVTAQNIIQLDDELSKESYLAVEQNDTIYAISQNAVLSFIETDNNNITFHVLDKSGENLVEPKVLNNVNKKLVAREIAQNKTYLFVFGRSYANTNMGEMVLYRIHKSTFTIELLTHPNSNNDKILANANELVIFNDSTVYACTMYDYPPTSNFITFPIVVKFNWSHTPTTSEYQLNVPQQILNEGGDYFIESVNANILNENLLTFILRSSYAGRTTTDFLSFDILKSSFDTLYTHYPSLFLSYTNYKEYNANGYSKGFISERGYPIFSVQSTDFEGNYHQSLFEFDTDKGEVFENYLDNVQFNRYKVDEPFLANANFETFFVINEMFKENRFLCDHLYDSECRTDSLRISVIDKQYKKIRSFTFSPGIKPVIHHVDATDWGGAILSGSIELASGERSGWIMTMDANGSTTFIKEPNGFYTNTSVYPNPTQEVLSFENPLANATYKVYNSNGQVVLSGVLKQNSLNVALLASGRYQILLENKNSTQLSGFIKQ